MRFNVIFSLIAISCMFGIFSFDYGASAQESTPQVNLDQTTYSWTDKVHITVISPAHNLDENQIESIGDSEGNMIQVYTDNTEDKKIQGYKLVETGSNTGIFTGEVTLTGFSHDADGNENSGIEGNDVLYLNATGVGPTDGFLPAVINKGISVSFTFSEDNSIVASAPVKWNEGKTEWLALTYPSTGTGVVRVTDPDMNWNPETIDNFSIDVWSDSDAGGINLVVTETDKASGIFEGTVFFSIIEESSGHRLRIAEGDTIYAEYEDNTLPSPNTIEDELDVIDTAMIGLSSDIATHSEPTGFAIIEYGMFDSEDYENLVHQLYVGKKYWFAFEYQNESEESHGVEEFVKLIDKNKTEDNILQKIEGSTTLEPSRGLKIGFGWTPEYVGEFEITAKVISPDDPLVGAIAPQYDLVVIARPLLKQQLQNQTPVDDILCKKSDHFLTERANKKLGCVSMDTAKKLGWKLVHFGEIILDPATKESLLERYNDLPEVVVFYEKYDAKADVREDHISYFAGNGDDFSVRMNLELDQNHDIENIEFHCYAQRIHQMDVAHENILNFLKGYTCDETGAHRNN